MLGSIGWTEILIIGLIGVLLFGAGRIADVGKGLGQGIKEFKKGIKDEDALNAADGNATVKSDKKDAAEKEKSA
jgi:sec-independent protein translocase protein TatA